MSAALIITYFAINIFGFSTERTETIAYHNMAQCESTLEIKYHKYDGEPGLQVDFKEKQTYLRVIDTKKRTMTTFKCKENS